MYPILCDILLDTVHHRNVIRSICQTMVHIYEWRSDKYGFNPLPGDKILDRSKLKRIADNILTLSQMTNFRLFQSQRVSRQQFQI